MTLTTYRNFFLSTCNNKSPVFIGPAFLHMEHRYQDYLSFLSCLIKLDPRLVDLKAYDTDGEKCLVNALNASLPYAISLRCSFTRGITSKNI